MRILFYIDSLRAGGKERRLTELMKAIYTRPDIEFELVLMNDEVHYRELLNLNINIHYLIRRTKKDLSVFKKLYGICKNYRPDIIHCWDSMTAIYSIPASRLLHLKMVNGMVVDTPVRQNVLNKNWLRAKITFPFSDLIIGNSKAGLAAYGAPVKKSRCIYNGADLGRFEKLKESSIVRKEIFGNDSPDLFIAGMVAAFENRKDYKTLIEAAIPLVSKNDKIRFVLIGNGTNFPELKDSVPKLLSDKIVFLGKISNVESVVNIFNVGILLTDSKVHGEGISNSIIEYMALGKPVIATRGGGTNEVVIDNQNGYLIDPANKDQLTEKIDLLMKDETLARELGEKGRQMVHDKFDVQTMTNHYAMAYNDLLKETKTK